MPSGARFTCGPVSPGLSVCVGACTVGVVFVGVEAGSVTVLMCGVGTVTGGAVVLLPLKTPKAARIAKKMARRERPMIATCVIVSVRPAITNSRWPAGARVLLLRQDPHFLRVLVDAAVRAALRLGRRLGLVEPVVVPRIVVAREPPWRGPYRVRRPADKAYNVGRR